MLGSILTVVATSKDTAFASLQLVTYAVGTAIPMLMIAYGGQAVTTRLRRIAPAPRLQQGFRLVVFERSASNVQAALKRHGITYPVAQDNDSRTWNAYRNQYWPAQYIIGQQGKIVFQHDGERQYDEIDRTIAGLLNVNG